MKNIFLLVVGLLFVNIAFSQEGEGEFVGGMGQFKMAYFGDICQSIERERDLAKCSQDQINEYISQLKTPEIVQKNNLNVTTTINFKLSESGEVTEVKIKKSSGNKEIDALCLEHIKKMPNWTPEISDDIVVASENMNLTFKFKATQKEK